MRACCRCKLCQYIASTTLLCIWAISAPITVSIHLLPLHLLSSAHLWFYLGTIALIFIFVPFKRTCYTVFCLVPRKSVYCLLNLNNNSCILYLCVLCFLSFRDHIDDIVVLVYDVAKVKRERHHQLAHFHRRIIDRVILPQIIHDLLVCCLVSGLCYVFFQLYVFHAPCEFKLGLIAIGFLCHLAQLMKLSRYYDLGLEHRNACYEDQFSQLYP